MIAASMQALAEAYHPDPEIDWPLFEEAVTSGWKSVEARLQRSGPLLPTRFRLTEANERLARWVQHCRLFRAFINPMRAFS